MHLAVWKASLADLWHQVAACQLQRSCRLVSRREGELLVLNLPVLPALLLEAAMASSMTGERKTI